MSTCGTLDITFTIEAYDKDSDRYDTIIEAKVSNVKHDGLYKLQCILGDCTEKLDDMVHDEELLAPNGQPYDRVELNYILEPHQTITTCPTIVS